MAAASSGEVITLSYVTLLYAFQPRLTASSKSHRLCGYSTLYKYILEFSTHTVLQTTGTNAVSVLFSEEMLSLSPPNSPLNT